MEIVQHQSPKYSEDSSNSSYDSYHLRETDFCRDSTDIDSESSFLEEIVEVLEYEVASESGNEALYSEDSSSGTDDIFVSSVTVTAKKEKNYYSDFADKEDSTSDNSFDPELSKADYWKCVKCKNKQNNPMFRYCEKCYQIRKSHFPPRPRKGQSKQKSNKSPTNVNINPSSSLPSQNEEKYKANSSRSSSCCSDTSSDYSDTEFKYTISFRGGRKRKSSSFENNSKRRKLDVIRHDNDGKEHNLDNVNSNSILPLLSQPFKKDSGISSMPSSQEIPSSESSSDCNIKQILSKCSSEILNNNLLTTKTVDDVDDSNLVTFNNENKSNLNLKRNTNLDMTEDQCVVCLSEPKNGAFIHTKSAHTCCCYKCAVKIWNTRRKCPICNCNVKNVLKLFVH